MWQSLSFGCFPDLPVCLVVSRVGLCYDYHGDPAVQFCRIKDFSVSPKLGTISQLSSDLTQSKILLGPQALSRPSHRTLAEWPDLCWCVPFRRVKMCDTRVLLRHHAAVSKRTLIDAQRFPMAMKIWAPRSAHMTDSRWGRTSVEDGWPQATGKLNYREMFCHHSVLSCPELPRCGASNCHVTSVHGFNQNELTHWAHWK